MRRAPLLLTALACVAVLLPVPALAAPCSSTPPHVRFDVNPKNVEPGDTLRYTFKFRFSAPCDEAGVADPSVTLQGETVQIYNSVQSTVRRTPLWDLIPHPEFRDAEDDNWDFNAPAPTTPGRYLFHGRVLLNDRQITASAPITVTVAGDAPTGGPTTSGGEAEHVAGPVPLEVTIGTYASAVDIPSYIAALYRYGLGVGVTLAMVMVVVGGFQYMVARGNPSAIGAARGRITNAVLGLLLLLGSFTLLQTVNPDLVTMRNIIVPEIRTVETISNRCEDFNREEYIVTPTNGRCGETGTVSRRDGVAVATNTCNWAVCTSANESCLRKPDGTSACIDCRQVLDDGESGATLSSLGLSHSNAGCARLTPPTVGETQKACVFLDSNYTFDWNDDLCALITVDCSRVSRCGQYDAELKIESRGEQIQLETLKGERTDLYGNADVLFKTWCDRNPCNATPGSCHAVRNAGTFSATFQGDFWNCMEGPG